MRAWQYLVVGLLLFAAFVAGAFCGAIYVDRDWAQHAQEMEQRRQQEGKQYRQVMMALSEQEAEARAQAAAAEARLEAEQESADDADEKPLTLITARPAIEVDREYAAGVTVENNAVVLFLQAYGPQIIENPGFRAAYFERLQMPDPGDDGPFLTLIDGDRNLDQAARQRNIDKVAAAWAAPWKLDDQPEAAQWLAVNEAPLKLCVEGIQREKFYDPILVPQRDSLQNARMYFVQFSRELSRLLAARAMNHIAEGRVEAALADAASIHRLSRLISQHPLIIPQLVAYTHVSFAALVDAELVQTGQLTAEQSRQQRELLAALPAYPALADIMDHGERRAMRDASREMASRKAYNSPVASKKRDEWIEQAFDEIVAACRLPDVRQRLGEMEAVAKRQRPHEQEMVQLDWTTTNLISLPAVPASIAAEARLRVRLELISLGYAIAEFRARHGEFPESLDKLIPDLIAAAPNDPYADVPVGYQVDAAKKSFRLFSRGPNGQDDGAAAGTDDIHFGKLAD